jgi:hypothetical protein
VVSAARFEQPVEVLKEILVYAREPAGEAGFALPEERNLPCLIQSGVTQRPALPSVALTMR